MDGVGNLYINQYSASSVSKWSPVTRQLTTLATGSFYPLGIATDPTGSIVYFADDNASTIRKVTSAFVGPASFTELAAAGTDSAHVLPPIASFTPTSSQSWLTANPAAGGSLGFLFTTNSTGSAQTAQITALGQTITVTQNPVTTPTITWPAPAGITYGAALSATQLNATASVPGTFSYSPAAATVLQAGQAQTLSVTFTPTDSVSYTTAAGSSTINVARATPVITLAAPAAIPFGTALSATQLNATASVPRRVRLHTARNNGVEHGAGQTLSALFTPTDTTDYTTATATTTITVNAVPAVVVSPVLPL